MGWQWWSSSPTTKEDVRATHDTSTPADSSVTDGPTIGLTKEQKERFLQRAGFTTREEQADEELESFLSTLDTREPEPSVPLSKHSDKPLPKQSTLKPAPERHHPDGSLNIHPEALYPSTMSCRQAFDQAFYCQSLGGKFNDIYRYGGLQSCSEQWSAFWFCMRTRALPALEREARVREHCAEREQRKMKKYGSSEDIWEIRTVGVQNAFHKDPDAED